MYRLTIEDGQSIDATLIADEAAFARILDDELECTRESHCRFWLQDDAFCLNNRCHAALPPSAPFHLEIIALETGEIVGQARFATATGRGPLRRRRSTPGPITSAFEAARPTPTSSPTASG